METKTANIKREATATSLILNLDTPLEIILKELEITELLVATVEDVTETTCFVQLHK